MGAGASTGKKNGNSKTAGLFGPDVGRSGFKIGGKQEEFAPIHHKKSSMSTTEYAFWRVEDGDALHIVTMKHDTISGSQLIIANGEHLHHCWAKFKLVGEVDFMLKAKHCKIDMRFKHTPKTSMHHWYYNLFVNGVKVPRLERLTTLHLWTVDVAGTEYEIQFEEESMRIYNNRKLVADAAMGFADVGSAYTFQIAGRRLELQVKPKKSEISVDLLVDGRVWPKLPQSAQSDLKEITSGIAKCNANLRWVGEKSINKNKNNAKKSSIPQEEKRKKNREDADGPTSSDGISSKADLDTDTDTDTESPKTKKAQGNNKWWRGPFGRSSPKQKKEEAAATAKKYMTQADNSTLAEGGDDSGDSPVAGSSSGAGGEGSASKMEESALV